MQKIFFSKKKIQNQLDQVAGISDCNKTFLLKKRKDLRKMIILADFILLVIASCKESNYLMGIVFFIFLASCFYFLKNRSFFNKENKNALILFSLCITILHLFNMNVFLIMLSYLVISTSILIEEMPKSCENCKFKKEAFVKSQYLDRYAFIHSVIQMIFLSIIYFYPNQSNIVIFFAITHILWTIWGPKLERRKLCQFKLNM